MSGEVQVHVGDTLESAGARAVAAWRRMERGESVSERHIGFADWETMVRVLSPKRLALLRHLHRAPAASVRALAAALARDYRRVHEDVTALQAAGLLERGPEGLRAGYDALDARIRVALQRRLARIQPTIISLRVTGRWFSRSRHPEPRNHADR